MVNREDVNLLVSIANLAAIGADRELTEIFATLPQLPELARDLLLETVPALVSKYEAMAATGAEEWYRAIRSAITAERFETVLGEAVEQALIQESVRWAVKPLFDEELLPDLRTATTRTYLGQVVERNVKNGVRSTITANALADPAAVMWARVPTGVETCAYCRMLAGRGWVYATKEAASKSKKTGGGYHAGCDCQVVPSFSTSPPSIAGYSPEKYQQEYEQAVESLKEQGISLPDLTQITSQMRRSVSESHQVLPRTPRGQQGGLHPRHTAE